MSEGPPRRTMTKVAGCRPDRKRGVGAPTVGWIGVSEHRLWAGSVEFGWYAERLGRQQLVGWLRTSSGPVES